MDKVVILQIALDTPLRRVFDYLPPVQPLPESLRPGVRVRVPFGRRQIVGVLVATATESTLDPAKLTEAVESNPAGTQKMLEQWSQNLQGLVEGAGSPGGTIDARVSGDSSQITHLSSQIATMNELLTQREKALEATYAQLEAVISKNTAQGDWLTSQEESLSKSGV